MSLVRFDTVPGGASETSVISRTTTGSIAVMHRSP